MNQFKRLTERMPDDGGNEAENVDQSITVMARRQFEVKAKASAAWMWPDSLDTSSPSAQLP